MNDKIKYKAPTTHENAYGHLKIFLGYAPGVGKTYSMLNEANRRLKRQQDVVIGYVETRGRNETEKQIGDLEIIPRKKVEYNGQIVEELDIDKIIERKPYMVLIDDLSHINAPGLKHRTRFEDVEEILQNGINVISTLNIHHIESLNDIIKGITGIVVKETIPDRIIENADEIVVVDITPDALQGRLKRGIIYKDKNIDPMIKNFFRTGNLNALREITLRQIADGVDEELQEYMKEHGINDNWHIVERVMVCITSSPSSKKLIRRGYRIAKRYKCEWYVISVDCTNIFAPKLSSKDMEQLKSHYKLAKQLGAEVVTLTGKSVSHELAKYATEKYITQIVIGHSKRTILQTLLRGSTVSKLLKHTKNVEVHVIPNDL